MTAGLLLLALGCTPNGLAPVTNDLCGANVETSHPCQVCEDALVLTNPQAVVDLMVAIEPETRPFLVERIGYFLEGANGCDPGRAHAVRVFVTDGPPPSQALEGLHEVISVEPSDNELRRPLELELQTPARVGPGQRLFVNLLLSDGSGAEALCPRVCPTGDPNLDFVADVGGFGQWSDLTQNVPLNTRIYVGGSVEL